MIELGPELRSQTSCLVVCLVNSKAPRVLPLFKPWSYEGADLVVLPLVVFFTSQAPQLWHERLLQSLLLVSWDSWFTVRANTREFLPRGSRDMSAVFIFSETEMAGPQNPHFLRLSSISTWLSRGFWNLSSMCRPTLRSALTRSSRLPLCFCNEKTKKADDDHWEGKCTTRKHSILCSINNPN